MPWKVGNLHQFMESGGSRGGGDHNLPRLEELRLPAIEMEAKVFCGELDADRRL